MNRISKSNAAFPLTIKLVQMVSTSRFNPEEFHQVAYLIIRRA